jgi:hypothetical protein
MPEASSDSRAWLDPTKPGIKLGLRMPPFKNPFIIRNRQFRDEYLEVFFSTWRATFGVSPHPYIIGLNASSAAAVREQLDLSEN